MVDKTVNSIMVKESRVEIIFLFHSNCLISQCSFYKKNHDSILIKIYDFLLVFRFLSRKHSASTQNRVDSVYTFSGILT